MRFDRAEAVWHDGEDVDDDIAAEWSGRWPKRRLYISVTTRMRGPFCTASPLLVQWIAKRTAAMEIWLQLGCDGRCCSADLRSAASSMQV